MKFTPEEKRRIDNLLEAFDDFISKHDYFDIGYTSKVGYVHFDLNNNQEILDCLALRSFDHVLNVLFDEVADDVRDPRVCTGDESYCLYPHEVQAVYSMIAPLADRLPTEAERSDCIDALDAYCRNNTEDPVVNDGKSAEVDWGSPRGEEVW